MTAFACLAWMLATPSNTHAQRAPRVADLHVDLPYQVHVHGRTLDDPKAPTSPARLRRGKVSLLIMPLFVVDAWRLPPSQVRASYDATYRALLGSMQTSPSAPLVLATRSEGRVSTLLAFEGADGFVDDPRALIPWIERGACLVGLVHTRTNGLAGSSSDPKSSARRVGLTSEGKALARLAYTSGALVDTAHASDAAVRDIVQIAKAYRAPLVCSHTGMRTLKPIERNISDEQLRWVSASGGVVGVDLHSGHVGRHAGRQASLDDFLRHLEHAVRIAGIDHVAIGSDLDAGILPPTDSDGAATWPQVANELRTRGWSQQDLDAVFHQNAERVLGWTRAFKKLR